MQLRHPRHIHPRPQHLGNPPTSLGNNALRSPTSPNLPQSNNLRKHARPPHRPLIPKLPSLRLSNDSRNNLPRRSRPLRHGRRPQPGPRQTPAPTPPPRQLLLAMVGATRHRRVLRDSKRRSPRRTGSSSRPTPQSILARLGDKLSRFLVRSGTYLRQETDWFCDVGG